MPTEFPAHAGAGRMAVVTGAASGMGLAVAERFLAEGRTVVGVDRDAEALAKAAASNGPAYHPVIADITDRTALSAALGARLPGVGAVVNAAGIYPATTLADYHEAVYRRIFDVNVLGTLNVIAETVPALRASGGAIVNFASIDAFAVSRGQLLYSASKAAIVSLTRSLAIELGDDNITVNAVAPGWVDTPGTRAGGRMEQAVKTIPLGRAAQPEEIADWVWKLCHGTYMTGETLVISGGLTVR